MEYLTVSALNHPNVISKKEIIPGAVSYKWIKEKIKLWCKPHRIPSPTALERDTFNVFEFEGIKYKANNLFLWKVLGEFPEESTDSLISLKKIRDAIERFKTTPDSKLNTADETFMSIDTARFGSDNSAIAIFRDNYISHKIFFHLDTAKLTGESINLIRKYSPSKVGIDCDGIGAGVFDNLNEAVSAGIIDTELIEIHGGASPVDMGQTEDFLNLRAQMYWLLKQDIEILAIETGEEIDEGLSSIKYFFNSKRKNTD